MSREEQHIRWILKELQRLEKQREMRELMNMRVVEQQQRKIEREIQRREKLERDRMIAREKEEMRVRALERARQIKEDLVIGAKELKKMRDEERYQRNIAKELKKRYDFSKDRLNRILAQRELQELSRMRTAEAEQLKIESKLKELELDTKIAERERLMMQNEDLSSRMLSLERSLGGHMRKIRETEHRHEEESKRETYSAFAEMRKISEELLKSTKEVKHAYDMKEQTRLRTRQITKAKNVDSWRQNAFLGRKKDAQMRTEKSMMEFEERRSVALMAALAKLSSSHGDVSDNATPGDTGKGDQRREGMLSKTNNIQDSHNKTRTQFVSDLSGVPNEVVMTPLPPSLTPRQSQIASLESKDRKGEESQTVETSSRPLNISPKKMLDRRGSYDQYAEHGPQELEWSVWTKLQNGNSSPTTDSTGQTDGWDVEIATMGRKSKSKLKPKKMREWVSPKSTSSGGEQRTLWPDLGFESDDTEGLKRTTESLENASKMIQGPQPEEQMKGDARIEKSKRILSLYSKMARRAQLLEKSKDDRSRSLLYMAEKERMQASSRRQQYEKLRKKAREVLGRRGHIATEKNPASNLRNLSNGKDLVSLMNRTPSLQNTNMNGHGIRVSNSGLSDDSYLGEDDRATLMEIASTLTKSGVLSEEDVLALALSNAGASKVRSESEAAVLEAYHLLLERKREASGLMSRTSQNADVVAATNIMKSKRRGMSIIGEAYVNSEIRHNTLHTQNTGAQEGSQHTLSSPTFTSSLKGSVELLGASPLAAAILRQGGAKSLAEISRLEPENSHDLDFGTQKSNRAENLLHNGDGIKSRTIGDDWLLDKARNRLNKPPGGIRSASIIIRGDNATSLQHDSLNTNDASSLPPPPAGIRSALEIGLDRLRQSRPNSIQIYGTDQKKIFTQVEYTPMDADVPLSPSPYTLSSGSKEHRLPMPPPGIRPARTMHTLQQNEKQQTHKSYGLIYPDRESQNADDVELEQWIRKNIPMEVLSGDEVVDTTSDPSGSLLRAHLVAKSTWKNHKDKTEIGIQNQNQHQLEFGSSKTKTVPIKYNYQGMEHPEVWVPSGSGPSSFHRQQLIDARRTLINAKMSKANQRSIGERKQKTKWPATSRGTKMSTTVDAAKMVPIPVQNDVDSGSFEDGFEDSESDNSDYTLKTGAMVDPELNRIHKAVEKLQSEGCYPSSVATPSVSSYLQSWGSPLLGPGSIASDFAKSSDIIGIKPLRTPDDINEGPRFLKRAMTIAQEAHYNLSRRAKTRPKSNVDSDVFQI